jgi:hypothetical protein
MKVWTRISKDGRTGRNRTLIYFSMRLSKVNNYLNLSLIINLEIILYFISILLLKKGVNNETGEARLLLR